MGHTSHPTPHIDNAQPRRRVAGEGSIRQRRDGRWEVRLWVGDRRVSRYAPDRAAAVALLTRLRGEHLAGRLAPPTRLTLGDFLAEWLHAHGPNLRPSTLESYRQLIAHVAPLQRLSLTRLEARHLAALYAQKRREGLSAGRVRKLHAVLRAALGDAVRWGLVGRNVAAEVAPPSARGEPVPQIEAPWTLAEVRAFVAACAGADRPTTRLLAFLLLTGMRVGEALALRWSDIDGITGTVTITKSLTHVGGKPIEGPPKSAAGVRVIALPPQALALVARQRRWQAERLARTPLPEERVFATATGSVPLRQNVRRSLHALCARAGLPAIRVHDLRKLHASLLAAGGADIKTVQRRLGHSSVQLTLNLYTKAFIESDRRAVQTLEALLPPGQMPPATMPS